MGAQLSKIFNENFFVSLITIVVTFSTLFWLAIPVLQIGFLPTHDYAADMLYTNSISLNHPLLVGHYSRFGFNHPGPFWFYLNKLIEIFFEWLPISRYNLWMVGSICINTLFIIFSGYALSNFLFNKTKTWVIFLLLSCLVLIVGGDFLSTWMPYRQVAVYIAFLVCLLDIAKGSNKCFTWCVLSLCILIHGYITMIVFTLAPFFLVMGLRYRNYKINLGATKTQFWIAGIIVVLFAAPIAIDAFNSEGGNLSKILNAQHATASQSKPSWTDVSTFFQQLIFDQPFAKILYIATIFPLIFTCFFLRNEQKKKVLGTLFFLILLSILMIVYYKTTPAPLYPHIARFYVGVPVIMTAVIWGVSIEFLLSIISNKRFQILVSVLLGSTILTGSLLISNRHTYPVFSEVRWGGAIQKFAEIIVNKDLGKRPIAINYSEYNQMSFVAGLMVELTNRNISVCTTWPDMGIYYTSQMLCNGVNVKPDYLVVTDDACKSNCEVELTGFGLIDLNKD